MIPVLVKSVSHKQDRQGLWNKKKVSINIISEHQEITDINKKEKIFVSCLIKVTSK